MGNLKQSLAKITIAISRLRRTCQMENGLPGGGCRDRAKAARKLNTCLADGNGLPTNWVVK
jgi:hypothetical protein